MSKKLEDVKKLIRIKEDEITALKQELKDLVQLRHEIGLGFKIGDDVIIKDGEKVKVTRFDGVFFHYQKYKKDGTISSRECTLYPMYDKPRKLE